MINKRCMYCQSVFSGNGQSSICPVCKKKLMVKATQKRIREDEGRKLYSSKVWQKCRLNIINKYYGYDIWLLAKEQFYRSDKLMVHHIMPRDLRQDLIFDEDNLVPVTRESHEEIHKLIEQGKLAETISRIEKGKQIFAQFFG